MTAKTRSRNPHRKGVTAFELFDMIPDEDAAHALLAAWRWGEDEAHRHCPRCGSTDTRPSKRLRTYWCLGCRERFSVRTGTVMECTRIPLRKWVAALYYALTNLKGISSMKLAREIGITQKSAWFVLHRIRRALADDDAAALLGSVEVDETYVGGRRRWMSNKKRREMGRDWTKNKTIRAGARDRATGHVRAATVKTADAATMSGFIDERVTPGATVYTDAASAYKFRSDGSVNHTAKQFADGDAHTQGIESFWSMFKRGYRGVYHYMSPKHLDRYAQEFAGRRCVRDLDTLDQLQRVVAGMVGRRLTYAELTADDAAK